MDATRLTERLAALAHPARLEIVLHLARTDGCGCGDVVDTLPLAQSTVSQHLKVLLEADLITHERKRPRSTYRLNRDALLAVSEHLNAIVDQCCVGACCGGKSNRLD